MTRTDSWLFKKSTRVSSVKCSTFPGTLIHSGSGGWGLEDDKGH